LSNFTTSVPVDPEKPVDDSLKKPDEDAMDSEFNKY
jgi:hypothetical protein